MTRFARAKGSKASNERAPEEATSWAVMKEQLERAKAGADHARLREQAEQQRIENYENFLKEQKSAKRKNTWCEFPSEPGTRVAGKKHKFQLHSQQPQHKGHNPDPIKDKKKNNKDFIQTENNDQNGVADSYGPETPPFNKKENKNIKRITGNTQIMETHKDETNNYVDYVSYNKKKKKKPKNNTEITEEQNHQLSKSNTHEINVQERTKKKKQITGNAQIVETQRVESNIFVDNVKSNKKKKNKVKPINTTEIKEVRSEEVLKSNDTGNNPQEGKKKKIKKPKPTQQKDNKQDKETPVNKSNVEPTSKRKKNKFEKGIVARRKPEGDHSFELVINSRPVELVRYDGFPVMKKDAERLEELKNSMMKKGIPKSEIQRTMKLERRRAEKALARLKRDVCYNCRKGGHNLSDCPELRGRLEAAPGAKLGMVGAVDGLCFKCGSTEHRAYECRVQRSQQYNFASCFICKEQGHIARQCPDNPKGLYPNGGSCKLCGDVTHLRKDCPTSKSEKDETVVRLDTLAAAAGVEDVSAPSAVAVTGTNKHKKVTF